jgi:hypothetical protein
MAPSIPQFNLIKMVSTVQGRATLLCWKATKGTVLCSKQYIGHRVSNLISDNLQVITRTDSVLFLTTKNTSTIS